MYCSMIGTVLYMRCLPVLFPVSNHSYLESLIPRVTHTHSRPTHGRYWPRLRSLWQAKPHRREWRLFAPRHV